MNKRSRFKKKQSKVGAAIVLWLMVLWIVFSFIMMSCTPTHDGEPTPNQKTAILVEGLFSHESGYVRDHWKPYLEEKGFFVYSEPWTTKRPIKSDLCACHSLGGGSCITKFVDCKVLITFDARSSKGDIFSKLYTSPGGTHFNFYQKKSFRGWEIPGALNIELKVGHTEMPKAGLDWMKENIK
jgi:hypothetical protein